MGKSQYIATIDSSTSGFTGVFTGPPADNVAAFTKAFEASKYKSIKEVIDDKAKIIVTGATLTCGIADPNTTPQPLPDKVEWSHSEGEGFTSTHESPCEVWCDMKRVFYDDNCAAQFTAELPYEKSKCSGASVLTMYWMAMHGPSWQVYVNCAPLSGGSGGGATTESSGSSASAELPGAGTPSTGESPATTTDSSAAESPTASQTTDAPAAESPQLKRHHLK
ncbi:hypothetical protein GN244_ATG11514 [Phytophthora infestans]|uniref:Uncharacterized protein n=1 Tax=Phytophthora infestans TaxID=4787 RepID=A0A833T3X5_PHYIN|nr:hypothetical protein GN244_ATG11514 [Phytophthora infestans]KAF4146124.1 hypothetical protein GN958_ATG04599 [Phytophthora infestans]KAI9990733.1 hypothetical protein PInf_018291 [Phytophthora infestans]